MLKQQTIAFLGAGSMAEAMIAGIVKDGTVPSQQIIVTNKSNRERLDHLNSLYGVRTSPLGELPYEEIDYFIMAMKPKGAEEALKKIKDKLSNKQVIISVLAGISTTFIEEKLNDGQQVITVMPNTSSMIQESATAMSIGTFTTDENAHAIKELLECMGKVFIIDENQMDIFTGLAGSGPAYFYYLMEHMEKTGINSGMDAHIVREIIAQTVYGAGKMMLEKKTSPAKLRENITSPNGTTAAGLNALRKFNGGEAITQAVSHAAKRSKEISDEILNPIPS